MAAKSKSFENALLKLLFQSVNIAGLADNAAAGNTVLWVTLHTADPGENGNQTTNEVAYTGMARIPIERSASGFTVNGNEVNPAAPIEFPEMTAGASGTATHMSIGLAETGAGMVLYRGALSPTIPYSIGVTPRLRTTTVVREE